LSGSFPLEVAHFAVEILNSGAPVASEFPIRITPSLLDLPLAQGGKLIV
jgi:hypothetical protein